jgi:hypothetical protein
MSWITWPGPHLISVVTALDVNVAAVYLFLFNIPFVFWAIVLTGIGLRELQGLSTARALLVVILPVAALLLCSTVMVTLILPTGIAFPGGA